MSSLLLLFGVLEGVLCFALPIINAFGKPAHVEHQLYFEVCPNSCVNGHSFTILLVINDCPYISNDWQLEPSTDHLAISRLYD